MKLLLDTHALNWALEAPERLPQQILDLLKRPETTVFVSAASVWEIALKVAVGRLLFPLVDLPQALADANFRDLPVVAEHGLAAARLPDLHRDPFDRMLAAQTACEGMTLVTRDKALRRYPIDTLWD